jgi:hypothetical protein
MMPDDDTNLTIKKIRRVYVAVQEARITDGDFWASVTARHSVQCVRFSTHLPDDKYGYIMATIPWLGSPTTMILPETWRQHLPPLPRLLTGEEPT